MAKAILLEPFRLVEAIYVLIRRPSIKRNSPIFILGFYRSGTTWLQELMDCDPDLCSPTIFQVMLPEFMLIFESVFKPVLQFFSKLLKIQNPYHRLAFDWNYPGEDDVAINAFSYLCDFNRIFQYPSQADSLLERHYIKPDRQLLKSWERAHLYYLDKLSLKYRKKRLLLKSPPNTGRIGMLKKMYPDAKFIFIKREEKICIQSNKRLWKINEPFSFERYQKERAEHAISKMYATFLNCYQRDKTLLKSNELIEISFEQLIESPAEVLENIYSALELDDSNEKRNLRQMRINERKGYQPINHQSG
ncbi:sulfotransferase [Gammaproteobacteria bacterium]|nr:sulfotransferase [Gammaproteobacteria bacterium]